MRTIQGLTDTITGIIATNKKVLADRGIATEIIKMLFEEDNLVVPPKQDNDLRLQMFNDFMDWHEKQPYVSIKREDFKEWLWSL